jgi:hypothetical protein
MANSIMLLQYLIIALVIYIPLLRFRGFRRLTGFADLEPGVDRGNGGEFAQRMVHIIAKAGKDHAVEQDGVMTFQCTMGMRLVTAALIGLLLFQLAILGFAGASDIFAFLLIAGLGAYFVYYLFTFRIQIYDNEVVWVDWFLRARSHDLSQLRRVEQDSSGGYRLEFFDGTSAYILRYINGHGLLKDFLLAALEINGHR